MSVGAGPNLSGGLSMSGMSDSSLVPNNGVPNPGAAPTCGIGDGGGGPDPGVCTAPANSGGGNSDWYNQGTSGLDGALSYYGAPVILPASILNRVLHYLDSGSTPQTSCPPIPGIQEPPSVPGPGSPAQQGVVIEDQTPHFVKVLPITCSETGVTLNATCSGFGVTFYQADFSTKHYTTPGGSGVDCSTGVGHTYSAGATTGSGFFLATLGVTRL